MTGLETIRVPGTAEGQSQAAAAFERFCTLQELSPLARWRFLVALDEILSNIVRHGLKAAGRDGVITLTFSREGDVVGLEVVDPAPAFNPLLAPVPDTTSPLETRAVGGLGVALVEALMDRVRYERKDHHNHLTLTWRQRPDVAGTPPRGALHGDS